MKRIACLVLFSLFLLGALSSTGFAVERIQLGVLPFDIKDCPPTVYRQLLFDNLKSELELSGYLDVYGIDDIRGRISKTYERLLNYRTPELLAEVGEAAGLDKILVGNITCMKGLLRVNFTLVDIRGKEVQKKHQVAFPYEKFVDAGIKHISHMILENVPLVGTIVQIRGSLGLVDIGLHHGIKPDERLIVYNKKVPITDLRNRILGFEEEAVGFVRIVECHEEWSKVKLEGTTKIDSQRVSADPEIGYIKKLYEGYKVRTYIDRDLLMNERKKSGAKSVKTRTRKPVHWR